MSSDQEHALARATAYYNDVQFASQLCGEFAAAESSNLELSAPLHEAREMLQLIVAQDTSDAPWANPGPARCDMDHPLSCRHLPLDPYFNAYLRQGRRSCDVCGRFMWRRRPLAPGKVIWRIDPHDSDINWECQECQFFACELCVHTSADRQPAWPLHEVLIRFDLPLQRLTTQFLVSKKWKPRFHILRGSRLYYCNGKKGYSDSHEGVLAFVRSNPAPDGQYCMDLNCTNACCVTAKGFAVRVCHTHVHRLQCHVLQRTRRRPGVRV